MFQYNNKRPDYKNMLEKEFFSLIENKQYGNLHKSFYFYLAMPDTSVQPQRAFPISFNAELKGRNLCENFSLQLPYEHTYLTLPLTFRHQKDISIAPFKDSAGLQNYLMILSVNNRDDQKNWQMRSLVSDSLQGSWTDYGEVKIEGIEGDEVCAAGLDTNAEGDMEIFVQTRCFGEGGQIIHARSKDKLYYTNPKVVLNSSPSTFKSNVYDAEPFTVTALDGSTQRYFTVTCVNYYENGSAKNGGIHLVKHDIFNQSWDLLPEPLFTEDSIPAHISTLNAGEWVPEGGKMLQVKANIFLFYGTCFTHGEIGTRQRGFFAIGEKITGPFKFLGTVDPVTNHGETGHGTILMDHDQTGAITIELFNQTRSYDNQTKINGPWISEKRSYRLDDFLVHQKMISMHASPSIID